MSPHKKYVFAFCAIFFISLSGLVLYVSKTSGHQIVSTPAQAPVPPIKAPVASPVSAPGEISVPGSFAWGAALNSVEHDGAGFFDPRITHKFVASVPTDLQKYVIELNSRAFLPLTPAKNLDLEEIFEKSAQKAEKRVAYIQFFDHPSALQRLELASKGLELFSYLSGYAWTARATPAAWADALKMDYVRGIAAIDPRDRMHALVFADTAPPYALAADGRTRFALLAIPGTDMDSLRRQLDAEPALASAEMRGSDPSVLGPRFEITADHVLARKIAGLESAAFLELIPQPVASRDATTDIESNVTGVRDSGPNLDGSNVTVMVREIGKMDLHVDFASRLTFIDNDGQTDPGNAGHATNVTGQIASSGVAQPSAKGIAPKVSVLAYSLTNDTFLTNDILNAASKGVRLSNHSYGPSSLSVWGDYQTKSADWDTALHDNNQIAMFAGNEETGGIFKHIDHFVGAKNTICVSATSMSARAGDTNPVIPKTDGIASFSEYGPMNDGRVKPDLVADGDSVTLDSGLNGVTNNSGTSFATPAVTGVAALVFQHYKAVVGSEPSAALMKALLCNSASDLGLPGPDAKYGFGIVNAEAAVATIDARVSASSSPFLEGIVSNGTSSIFTVNIQNFAQLKATLCWMDVAGVPSAAKALVNDLDLELTAPDGTKYFPFSLDPNNPGAAATNTSPNRVDPIEQTIVDSPVNGIWTIKVIGTSIPQGMQSFAVCLNLVSQPPPLSAVIIASPQAGPVSLDVSFSAVTNLGQAQDFSWVFGDGASGQGVNVEHIYETPGTYTAMLTITDANQKQASATIVITVTKRQVDVFPLQAQAKLNFTKELNDSIKFSVVAGELVQTPQQAREALRDGTLEGTKFLVRVAGAKVADKIVLDQRAGYSHLLDPLSPTFASFKLNIPKGEIDFQLTHADLGAIFNQQGMTSTPGTGTYDLPIEIEGANVVYRTTFKVQYKNANGKTGTAAARN